MPPELMAALPQVVLYVVFAVILLAFFLSKAAEASESFAKLFGPLGRFWRRKLEQERKDRLKAFHDEAKRAVNTELGTARKAEYASLKQQLGDVLDRVADMERNEAIYDAYLVLDAEWHRQINLTLAELGVLQAPLPDRLTFTEFVEDFRKRRGWEKVRR